MIIDWNPTKNAESKARFGFGFERVLTALDEGALLDVREHPNSERYGHQRQLVIEIDAYAWVVSLVSDGDTMFFKTMYPSRKANKDYPRG